MKFTRSVLELFLVPSSRAFLTPTNQPSSIHKILPPPSIKSTKRKKNKLLDSRHKQLSLPLFFFYRSSLNTTQIAVKPPPGIRITAEFATLCHDSLMFATTKLLSIIRLFFPTKIRSASLLLETKPRPTTIFYSIFRSIHNLISQAITTTITL